MKTIGLLGGMSWESTQTYYKLINEGVRDRLGGLHSAQLVLYSVDFEPIERLQNADRWDDAATILADAARSIEAAGGDFLVLCTNTMHKVAPSIEAAISIPLLHIADATAEAIKAAGLSKVGLLGTRFTMTEEFYRGRLTGQHGIEVLVPDESEREVIDRVSFDELCRSPEREVRRLVAFLQLDLKQSELDQLVSLPRIPASTGRYKNCDLTIFDGEELGAVRDFGFDVHV